MKTLTLNSEAGRQMARSLLGCGGHLLLLNGNKLSFAPQSARGLAQSKTCRISGTLLTFLAITISIHAQSYSIDWYKIAGGGGTSTGATYQVTATIGQPDASGAMSGGNYSLTGGFWSLISVVQTIGAPTLLISHSGNAVTVCWQNVSGWNLQQNNNLTLPANWSPSGGVTTSNGTNYLNVTPLTGNLFFRLSKP
jgi:hypothetical protein